MQTVIVEVEGIERVGGVLRGVELVEDSLVQRNPVSSSCEKGWLQRGDGTRGIEAARKVLRTESC